MMTDINGLFRIAESEPINGRFVRLRYDPLTDGVYVELWANKQVRLGGEHCIDRKAFIRVLEEFKLPEKAWSSLPPAEER